MLTPWIIYFLQKKKKYKKWEEGIMQESVFDRKEMGGMKQK